MSKHFIAALGINCYNACDYELKGEVVHTSFVQEALLQMLDFNKDDRITILLTELARKNNWENRNYTKGDINSLMRYAVEGEKLPKVDETKEGLCSRLKQQYGEACLNPVNIWDGKDEDEIWKNFQIVFEQIQDEEEIYFDITNGFRSLPMLALTILNYSKVLKNVKIKAIYYGALDAKNKETGKVPIFDLTSCNDILNWTVAADNFIRHGNSEMIGELCNSCSDKEFKSEWKLKLKEVVNLTNCIEASRGMKKDDKSCKENSIGMAYNSFKMRQRKGQNSSNVEKIVLPLYVKVEKRAAVFDKETNYDIGMATVEWSIANGMIQQGFTALLETIKTFLCNLYEIDEYEYETRDGVVAKVLNILGHDRDAMGRDVKNSSKRKEILSENDDFLKMLKEFEQNEKIKDYKKNALELAYEVPKCIVDLYGDIGKYRNDMNHFGFNKQPMKYKVLRKKLSEGFDKFQRIALNYEKEKMK